MKAAKITTNIILLVFAILSVVRWDGDPTFHIAAGCGFAVFFIVHFLLNIKPFTAMTRRITKLNAKSKRKYIIDMLLIIVWCGAIITGFIAITNYSGDMSIHRIGRLHGVFARVGCFLAIVHIFQHLKQIRSYFKTAKKTT